MKPSAILAVAGTLAVAGCISRQAPAPDWPASVPLKSLSQLSGVYRNEGQGGGAYGRSLYDLLNGQLGTSSAKGKQTELRPSLDGKVIEVFLRDGSGRLLDSVLLREKTDFISSKEGLSVKVPGSLNDTGVTNLGLFTSDASVIVRPTATGGLLGEQSEFGAGFLGFMIPIAAASEEDYYWPVLPR